MIMWHRRVGQTEMGESVVDRIGKGRHATDVRRLAYSLRADRKTLIPPTETIVDHKSRALSKSL
jgi:hypothetical protein